MHSCQFNKFTMNSPSHYQTLHFVASIILLLLLFVYPSKEEVLFEEMTMLGSRPPSCHNKCNSCHPCMAVQVTAQNLLSLVQNNPGSHDQTMAAAAATTNSNYKPLGWKCMCKDHVFNP